MYSAGSINMYSIKSDIVTCWLLQLSAQTKNNNNKLTISPTVIFLAKIFLEQTKTYCPPTLPNFISM